MILLGNNTCEAKEKGSRMELGLSLHSGSDLVNSLPAQPGAPQQRLTPGRISPCSVAVGHPQELQTNMMFKR